MTLPGDPTTPVVSIVQVEPLGGRLYRVRLMLPTGRDVFMVIDSRQAAVANVRVAAAAVLMLSERGRV